MSSSVPTLSLVLTEMRWKNQIASADGTKGQNSSVWGIPLYISPTGTKQDFFNLAYLLIYLIFTTILYTDYWNLN